MKKHFVKLLSTFLSAILVFSVTVVGLPTTVNAETATTTSTTGENLMADYTAENWAGYVWNDINDDRITEKRIRDESANYYSTAKGAIFNKEISWQYLYTKVNLEPNTTYTFKFSTYSTAKEFTMHKIYYAELDKSKTITWKSTVLQNNTNHLDTLLDSDAASSDTSLKLEAWNDVSVSFTTTSATDVDRYIIFQFGKCYSEVNNASATAPAWVTGFSLLPVRTEFATAYNNAASIRLGTNTDGNIAKDGLRVKNEITTKFIQDNKITEYGSVVAFADSLGTNELTLETAGAKTGVAYNSTTNNLWATTTDSNIYTAYITGFKDATSYSKEIAVRAYAKNSSGNVYYGKTFTVCLYDVVYAIKNAATADGSTPSKLDTTTAQAFIDKDSNTYNTWKNGKAS